jgi:hypothetical protein
LRWSVQRAQQINSRNRVIPTVRHVDNHQHEIESLHSADPTIA